MTCSFLFCNDDKTTNEMDFDAFIADWNSQNSKQSLVVCVWLASLALKSKVRDTHQTTIVFMQIPKFFVSSMTFPEDMRAWRFPMFQSFILSEFNSWHFLLLWLITLLFLSISFRIHSLFFSFLGQSMRFTFRNGAFAFWIGIIN